MWYEKFNFLSREAPTSDEDLACFFQTADKHIGDEGICALTQAFPEAGVAEKFAATGLRLPDYFYIPEEMEQLWRYAVSGEIEGNGREFGYFSPKDVVEFYFSYEFWYFSPKDVVEFYFSYEFWFYAPHFLPVAFDGGGVFYVYDFRQPDDLRIVLADSGFYGEKEGEYTPAGKTLAEVLSRKPD